MRFVFLPGYIVEVVCSVVQYLGDDKRAFPGRGELVWTFLMHSKDQVSFLECSASDVASMESTQFLLIDGRPDQGHLSLLFQKVDCILASLLCLGFGEEFHSGGVVQ